MTKVVDVTQTNILIAEFMGLTKEDRYLSFSTGRYCKNDNDGCYPDPIKVFIKDGRAIDLLKYNVSWDWLIPVIKKIAEVSGDNVGLSQRLNPYTYDIENIYTGVVEFIKSFNNKNNL